MNNNILDWNGTDHRAIYTRQLKENPLYYDPDLKVWVVYSYECCKAILLNAAALVPEPVINENSPLNDKAKLLMRNLARLSNGRHHEAARGSAMLMYQKISRIAVDKILQSLLCEANTENFDWVEAVALRLPVRVILDGLNFDKDDSDYITVNLGSLVKIMNPLKAGDDTQNINSIVNDIYTIAEKYIISSRLATGMKAEDELVICNLIGLFIQCYDAGRGLLSNTLLSFARNHGIKKGDMAYYQRLITETLRWDPPVQNTRRIAVKDFNLAGQIIRNGEVILIVLAAANLDPIVFKNANQFDIMRNNNDQHLTFGIGGHNCIAKYLCINMAAQTCAFLANNYQNITINQKQFSYEPQLNVRLIKEIMITIT